MRTSGDLAMGSEPAITVVGGVAHDVTSPLTMSYSWMLNRKPGEGRKEVLGSIQISHIIAAVFTKKKKTVMLLEEHVKMS